MRGMRSVLAGVVLALTGCVTIHTIDLGAGRSPAGANCEVPMNKGGTVPDGWVEIGRVQVDGATKWSEAQFADEFRTQACDMGAEYVVVRGDGEFVEAIFLAQQMASSSQEQNVASP